MGKANLLLHNQEPPSCLGGLREKPQDLRWTDIPWEAPSPSASLIPECNPCRAVFQVLDGADASVNEKEDVLGKPRRPGPVTPKFQV